MPAAPPPPAPPPRIGEANRYVYSDLLGYTDAEIADFEARGLVGDAYSEEAIARALCSVITAS